MSGVDTNGDAVVNANAAVADAKVVDDAPVGVGVVSMPNDRGFESSETSKTFSARWQLLQTIVESPASTGPVKWPRQWIFANKKKSWSQSIETIT